MHLYPAIDLKDGKCVRLKQGLFDQVTAYSDAPWKMAKHWEEEGGCFLHLVDLDGALKGRSVNAQAIRDIVSAVSIPTELGGGIRTLQDIDEVLGLGVSRVILGTKALQDPEFVKEAVTLYGSERIVVGIDAKNGMVATHGWENVSEVTALELAVRMQKAGVKTIIYTDISRDGMLSGPNVEATKKLSDETGLEVIASGGMSSMEDLQHLYEAGIPGAIIGKALYENRINLKEAVNKFEAEGIPPIPWSCLKKGCDGLVPCVVQEAETKEVLMLAYMNQEAYEVTCKTRRMTYFSRSRNCLWVKGETSGHFQYVKFLQADCDKDTLLAAVTQVGPACHTGSHSCFFRSLLTEKQNSK